MHNAQFYPDVAITRADSLMALGTWQFIDTNGRAVTGWHTDPDGARFWFDHRGNMVSGRWVQIAGNWFYFYESGRLAVSTVIDGYTIGEDGARE